MKRKYLITAGIMTMIEALLFGCGAQNPGKSIVTPEINEKSGSQIVKELPEDAVSGKTIPDGTETETENNIFCPMVMLDGKLYVETGETNSMPRCGVMDGTISLSTDGETPTVDNQSNFGKNIGFQRGMRENRIEICLDNVWHIFACNENNLDGVELEVKDASESGAVVTVHNSSDFPITYGEDFLLEVQEPSGEWRAVSIAIEGDYGFNNLGYPAEPGASRDWTVDWTWLYGELEPGHYRIVKSVLSEAESEEINTAGSESYEEYFLMCEFDL